MLLHITSRLLAVLACLSAVNGAWAATLTGTIVDSATSQPLSARVYIQDSAGEYYHVKSLGGTAIPYAKRRTGASLEVHTTISAHPFFAELPAGKYTVVVEKGKEYFRASHQTTLVGDKATSLDIRLTRWTNMAAKGWFSGETHVHREVTELPTLQLAEDINVAFPLTAWVTDSEHTPATHNKNQREVPPAKLIQINKTHVCWPVNTEYEIFSVRGKRHTLGAVFILNHKQPLDMPAPPVRPIANEARAQGGFLELDKHNWPWSIMLVPQMNVDLFELSNNHIWRTGFMFSNWYPEYVAPYMHIEMVDGKFTEQGWMDFGFQTYYALLNCGFKMKPTAGTASGVHPVPFGYGRVYVKLNGEFSYPKWIQGLLTGRSFVTTGPMLTTSDARIDDQHVRFTGELESANEPLSIEFVVNGKIVKTLEPQPKPADSGVYRVSFAENLTISTSSWVAVRAFSQRPGNRRHFAHTAPVYFEVAGQPLRPTRAQRDYLAKRVRDEIQRNRDVLSAPAMKEFHESLEKLEAIQVAD